MNIIYKIRNWGNLHHPKILGLVRMALGIFLIVRGFTFLNHTAYLRDLLIENRTIRKSPEMINTIINYIIYMHMVGGVLILTGLFTRLGVLLQLPVVFGALFFGNSLSPFVHNELWLKILVLALLFLFLVMGSGPLSLDRLLNIKMEESEKAPGN